MTTEPAVTAPEIMPPKPPRTLEEASELLANIGSSERRIRLLYASYGRRIARHQASIATLETQRDNLMAPHAKFIETGVKLLATWYKNHIKKLGKGRTISLPAGDLKCELDPWSVELISGADAARAIAKVRRRGIRYLSISVSLNKKEITKNRSRFRHVRELMFSRNDRFKAIPGNLGKTEKPKEDRLNTPVATHYYPPRRTDVARDPR